MNVEQPDTDVNGHKEMILSPEERDKPKKMTVMMVTSSTPGKGGRINSRVQTHEESQ